MPTTNAPQPPPAAPPPTLERLDIAFGRIRRLWESPALKRRFVARLGVPIDPGVIRTLRAVEQIPDEPGVSDVASWLNVDTSTASRLVDGAVAAGYLERRACERDRRRCRLSVTPEGAAVLDRIIKVRSELLAELTDGWSQKELEGLSELLERLADRIADLEEKS